MKKVFLSVLMILGWLGIGQCSEGDFFNPRDQDGEYAQDLSVVGVRVYFASATTTAFLIPGSSIAIHGVLTSTRALATENTYLFLRATNTANTSSALLVPPIEFSSTTRNTFVVFTPPIISPLSVSVNIATGSASTAAVFYRYLATASYVAEDFEIPIDANGKKSNMADFYGVKAATVVTPGAADGGDGTFQDFNSNNLQLATVPSLFYGVVVGTTLASTSYAVFYDTASTIGTPTKMFIPPLFYGTFNYEDITLGNKVKTVYFPWPLITANGLTVQNSVATNRFRTYTRPRKSVR